MPVFTLMKLIDVSVTIDTTLPSYPGNTPFSLEAVERIAQGASSNVSTVHRSAHTGTHVDAPRHFFDSGSGTEALPLELLCGRTRVVEVTTRKSIAGTIVIEGLNLRDVEPGIYDMMCLPLKVAGSDGAPARVVLRAS
jgi:arylformamidase